MSQKDKAEKQRIRSGLQQLAGQEVVFVHANKADVKAAARRV